MTKIDLLLKKYIRDVPDFPKKGIIFKDITPIFQKPELFDLILKSFIENLANIKIDAIAAIESRGFFFGILLADKLKVPFIPIRKSGKLPYNKISCSYKLEYGTAELEMHIDAVQKNWNVLIHDDLLATGGTAIATANLIQQQGAKVSAFAFLIELCFLNGANEIANINKNIISLVKY